MQVLAFSKKKRFVVAFLPSNTLLPSQPHSPCARRHDNLRLCTRFLHERQARLWHVKRVWPAHENDVEITRRGFVCMGGTDVHFRGCPDGVHGGGYVEEFHVVADRFEGSGFWPEGGYHVNDTGARIT